MFDSRIILGNKPKLARLNAARAGLKVTIMCGDAAQLPIENNSVDVVITCRILHDLPATAMQPTLTEAHWVCAPDGTFGLLELPLTHDNADFNALKLPGENEHEESFILLADIFPTGWHGMELANLHPGESIAIFGAGPVGLMAAYSAKIKGAAEIYVVDRVESRLKLAEEYCDVTLINFEEADPVEQIRDAHGGG